MDRRTQYDQAPLPKHHDNQRNGPELRSRIMAVGAAEPRTEAPAIGSYLYHRNGEIEVERELERENWFGFDVWGLVLDDPFFPSLRSQFL